MAERRRQDGIDALAVEAKTSREAMGRLVSQCSRYLWSLVHHYRYLPLDQDDLYQLAAIGLIKAARSFDPDKGTWWGHLKSWVRQSISNDPTTRQTPVCSLPDHEMRKVRRHEVDHSRFWDLVPLSTRSTPDETDRRILWEESQDIADRHVSTLKPLVQAVVRLRCEGRTHTEIGRLFGFSKQRSVNIIREAREALQHLQ